MNWIKNRFDQLILAVVAVALLIFAAMVITKTGSFEDQFSKVNAPTIIDRDPPLDPTPELPASLTAPPVLHIAETTNASRDEHGSLFWPGWYIPTKNGPQKPEDAEPLRADSLTGRSIPNTWFLENKLPLLQGAVALQDPDKDGFTNEEEWRGQTDPNDASAHPPYHTKLFLKQIIRTPFRLAYFSENGDLRKPEKVEFQINTLDLKQPSAFVKLGEQIPNTKFKVDKFERKEVFNPQIGGKVDVSELTLIDTESNVAVTLVKGIEKNVPDEYVVFDYQWPPAAQDIRVKKLRQFVLKPETDKNKLYKLVDIRESEAVIQTPDQGDYPVVRDPRKTAK